MLDTVQTLLSPANKDKSNKMIDLSKTNIGHKSHKKL
jgi:hypothetical protein